MFFFWKIWRALFSCAHHFKVRLFALLPTKYQALSNMNFKDKYQYQTFEPNRYVFRF